MTISIIAAMDMNRGLGEDNKLSWHLPDDLRRFKEITQGHPIIMGRKTHESIGRILPNRQNIIITRNPEYNVPGAIVVGSMEEAIRHGSETVLPEGEIFIIGGAEMYRLGLPYANKLYLTFVDVEVSADIYFPEFSGSEWNMIKVETHEKDEKHPYAFTFKIYEKK